MKAQIQLFALSALFVVLSIAIYIFLQHQTADRFYGCQGAEHRQHIEHIQTYLQATTSYRALPWQFSGCQDDIRGNR